MKHIALLLAALLVFSLTGCSSSEAAGTASDTNKAGAYEVIPPEDGRGDLIPASSDVASIPVLVGGGLPFTSMENLMNENYEDGTYTYEDMTQDGSVLVVDMAFQSLRTDETVEEYAEVSRIASDAPGVHALEINISCPNVKTGGIAFGTDPVMTHEVVAAVRKASRLPVIPKLSPNVTDITVFARACEEAGADAISRVNTFLGLAIDVETRKPRLAFGTGGLSGPAIRPLAVRMTWQAARAVKIPIIGIGGIASPSDALEFFIAGAAAVQVGTLNFSRPNIYAEIEKGLVDYLTRHQLANIRDLVGTIRYPR